MSVGIVLGTQDTDTGRALEGLLSGESGFTVRAVATSPESLFAAVLDHEPDAILLHEDFGPAPALTVARDLVERLPWVSIVMLTREPTRELYAAASDVGIRSLVSLPPSLTDLSARLTAAAWWSRTVRLGSEAKRSYDEAGLLLTVVGSKGGVGTTTIASQLAFVAAGPSDRRVCLVDLDLFSPDLAAYLATDPARTLRELVDLSDELNPGVLQPVLYPHESGVRVLFAPEDVTEAELVTASVVRRALGVLRTMFDVVVVDCGRQVSEATLPAIELADRLALVATPDLLSLRAAHRMVESWELLDARRRDAVELVLNRVSRNAAVQPRLVGQTSAVRVVRVNVPAGFGALEELVNEGATGLRHQRSMARPLTSLALHFGILPPPRSRFAPLWRLRRGRSEESAERSALAPGPPRAGGRHAGIPGPHVLPESDDLPEAEARSEVGDLSAARTRPEIDEVPVVLSPVEVVRSVASTNGSAAGARDLDGEGGVAGTAEEEVSDGPTGGSVQREVSGEPTDGSVQREASDEPTDGSVEREVSDEPTDGTAGESDREAPRSTATASAGASAHADAQSDGGSIAVEVAAIGVVMTIGAYLLVQLVVLAWTLAVLALATPVAADAVADGATVQEVEADLRSGDSVILDGAEVSQRGERVVVEVPAPVGLGIPGLTPGSLSSDAGVVSDAAPAG